MKREKESVQREDITMVMEGSVKMEEMLIQEQVVSETGSKEKQQQSVLRVQIERLSQPSDLNSDPLSKHSNFHKNSKQVHNAEDENSREQGIVKETENENR